MEIIIFVTCCIGGWLISRPIVRLMRLDYAAKRGMAASRIRVRRV